MMKIQNSFKDRTRFKLTLIGFICCMATAIAKHWFAGISEAIIGIGAGLITAYIAGESFRKSSVPNQGEKHDPTI